MTSFSLSVIGLPAPKGSTTAIAFTGKDGKAHATVTDKSNKSARDRLSPWKVAVSAALQEQMRALSYNPLVTDLSPMDGALSVVIVFHLPRPKSAPKSVRYPTKKPDLSKLVRAAEDVCTKIVWTDDARIVRELTEKRFAVGRLPGMDLHVQVML